MSEARYWCNIIPRIMKLRISVTSFITLFVSFSVLSLSAGAGREGLRAPALEREFYIGAAVDMKPFHEDEEYRNTLAEEFNVIVAENAFKFENIHPERGRYDFADADALVAFASEHAMKLRGHTLVWHRQLPAWITGGEFTREEAIEILRDHIETVAGRYRGRIWAWDVVNEAVEANEDGFRRDSFWYRTIGPEYVQMAFEMARNADPDAILYYNDFDNEGMNSRSNAVYRLLSDLTRRGAPVDGVGWQMHVPAGFRIKKQHRENARRLGALGLELSITELDVRIRMPAAPDAYAKQAATYREVTGFCLSEPACRSLVTWGFTDRHSWIPAFFPGEGDALLFDYDLQPKPAYEAVRGALRASLLGRPQIREARIEGRDLLIAGGAFDRKSAVFLDWRRQKASVAKAQGNTMLLIRGAAARIPPGQTVSLYVRSGDGKLSPEFRFTRTGDGADDGNTTK